MNYPDLHNKPNREDNLNILQTLKPHNKHSNLTTNTQTSQKTLKPHNKHSNLTTNTQTLQQTLKPYNKSHNKHSNLTTNTQTSQQTLKPHNKPHRPHNKHSNLTTNTQTIQQTSQQTLKPHNKHTVYLSQNADVLMLFAKCSVGGQNCLAKQYYDRCKVLYIKTRLMVHFTFASSSVLYLLHVDKSCGDPAHKYIKPPQEDL